MSYQQPKQSPCFKQCGRLVHFNRGNPQGVTSTGKMRPLEYVQTPQGTVEQPHNCPNYNPQGGQPQGGYVAPQVMAPAGGFPAAPPAGPASPAATGPSITQMLLEVAKEHLAIAKEQLAILKALHPELEQTPVQSTPETPSADEIELDPNAQ